MAMEGAVLFATCGVLSTLYTKRLQERGKRQIGKISSVPGRAPPPTNFDVIIIGAGPSGSTAAFYAAKNGVKVGLFDKKVFPRNKPCGDAWCKPALDILEDMGVLAKMEADGITHAVTRGGLISPFGYQCINRDGASYGSVTGCKTYAIKREIADVYLVRAAAAAGANLFEGTDITSAVFTAAAGKEACGHWTVTARNDAGNEQTHTSRLLLICDGSTSYMAQKLGIIPQGSQSEAVCSTCYIQDNAWADADGVMIFNRSTLPGYSALFKHYNGDLYVGTYILPGGKATARCIAPFETEAMKSHPYIQAALGDNYQWRKKRTVAPIRLGGVDKSYGQQALLVGDAAGHVDPLTGEGIHTAMMAAKIAAQCVQEMLNNNNYSEAACQAYQLRCWDSFVHEFVYSSIAARVVNHLPIAIDAVACVGNRRGQAFLDFFGEVMTGVRPKSAFLQPGLLLDLTIEMAKQVILQYVLGKKPLIPTNIGQELIDSQAKGKGGV